MPILSKDLEGNVDQQILSDLEIIAKGLSGIKEMNGRRGENSKPILKGLGWQTEFKVIPDESYNFRFDGYKNGVALEIEWSTNENVLQDIMKFALGHKYGGIKYGIIFIQDATRPKPFETQEKWARGLVDAIGGVLDVGFGIYIF